MRKIFALFNLILFFCLNATPDSQDTPSNDILINGSYVFSKYNNTFILGTSYKTGDKLKLDLEFEYDKKNFLTNETTSDLRFYSYSGGINYRIVNNRKLSLPFDIMLNFHYAYSNYQDRYNSYINEEISENAFIYGFSIKKDFSFGENYGISPLLKINHLFSLPNYNNAILITPQIHINITSVYCFLKYDHYINILGNSTRIYQAYNEGLHLGLGIIL